MLTNSYLALDIGQVRIGLAIASTQNRLARPLITLKNDHTFLDRLLALVADNKAKLLVVGLPRGLDGQDTAQTSFVRQFATTLKEYIGLPIYFQDEALTSKQAENELISRRKAYTKEDVDALSATYILEDFLGEVDKI
ncbi:MAG TPA: Holliday junction resolvase RuvX [Candidatus Dormibacteraeota bacterium]|nr:Holliday junction resolvase RuvX [Candidatus Dormibacteraeota bacterium]